MPARATLRLTSFLALAVLFLASCDSSTDYQPGEAFYLEARAEVSEDGDFGAGPTVTEVRWWWEEPSTFRIEYERVSGPGGTTVVVADGSDLTTYDTASGTYSQQPVPEAGAAALLGMSALVGPVDYASVEEFEAAWASMANAEFVRRAGTESVLGRDVEVIEYGPTWRSSSSDGGESSGGLGRLYVDPASMMVLRSEVDGGVDAQSYVVEVTHLDLDPSFEDGTFAPDPPDDAREVDGPSSGSCSSSGSGSLTDGWPRAPGGFLQLREAPEGWRSRSESRSEGADCQVTELQVVLGSQEDPQGQWVAFTQRRWRGDPPPMDGEPVDLGGGREAFASVEDGSQRLAWMQDGVWALLVSNTLPREELIRMAASAEVVP